jgi:predicted Rossmann fold nucleotide-binding protein DprA/Smf involved in DNA uptake
MSRNKSIYGLADAVVVIAATAGKGGTWAGATEALKKGWGPVFVQPTNGDRAADKLMALGAARLPELPDRLTKGILLERSSAPGAADEVVTAATVAQFTVFGEPEAVEPSKRARGRVKAVRRKR